MIELTQDELELTDELIALTAKSWNAQADEGNQWCDLCQLERVALVLRFQQSRSGE